MGQHGSYSWLSLEMPTSCEFRGSHSVITDVGNTGPALKTQYHTWFMTPMVHTLLTADDVIVIQQRIVYFDR